MAHKKKIVVSVITDLATDQRVIRICSTLQEMGFEVTVLARKFSDSLTLEKYNFKARRFRCYFRKGTMQYAEFMIQLFFRLMFTRTNYFLANDLDSLLPNYLVSKIRPKYLFYDTHEYFTGVPELTNSPIKYKIWKGIEDWIFPKLKTVYTVNDSVKNEYEKEYPVKLKVIRNVPFTTHILPSTMPANWDGKIILLAQGAGLNPGRSCIEMIDAMPYLDDRFHLVFIGGGTAWEDLKKRREELKLENRIDMLGKMLPSKLKSYTALAHLGLSMDSFEDKNYLFNLPNKVFDYLQASVPLFATAIPEVKKIIDDYDCGIAITNTAPDYLAEVITELFANSDRYNELKQNAAQAAKDLCWEKEEEKLKDIYRPFL